MRYKPYDKYKDSKILWIDKIPSKWNIIKAKHCFELNGGYAFKSDDFIDEGIPLIRIGDISDGTINFEKCKRLPLEYATIMKEYLVNPGDILIALTGATIGKIGQVPYTDEKILLNQRVAKLSSNTSNYYKYVLSSDLIKQQIKLISEGSAQENISNEDIGNFDIFDIDDDTKQGIVNYLDKKVEKIDSNIAENKKLIGLLEEKRITLINQVVTKGLNPDVPMKDSGIEWIGEIPEHWEIKRFKYNCYVNPSNKKVVSNENLKINFLPMEKVSEEGEYDAESLAQYSSISKGYTYFEDNDVLLAKITPCFENGKGALVKDLKHGFGFGSTEFHVLRFKENVLPEFIYYFIRSYSFRTIGEAFMQGTAGQKRVGTEFIENYMMVTPPFNEQIEIVEYLNVEINKLTNTISKITENINLLEEYKTSLIHHAITGKIDVRGEEI